MHSFEYQVLRYLVFIRKVIQTDRPRSITVENFHEFVFVDVKSFMEDVGLVTLLLGKSRVKIEFVHVFQSLVSVVAFVHFSCLHEMLKFFFNGRSLQLSTLSDLFVGDLKLRDLSGLKQGLIVNKLSREGVKSFKDV